MRPTGRKQVVGEINSRRRPGGNESIGYPEMHPLTTGEGELTDQSLPDLFVHEEILGVAVGREFLDQVGPLGRLQRIEEIVLVAADNRRKVSERKGPPDHGPRGEHFAVFGIELFQPATDQEPNTLRHLGLADLEARSPTTLPRRCPAPGWSERVPSAVRTARRRIHVPRPFAPSLCTYQSRPVDEANTAGAAPGAG